MMSSATSTSSPGTAKAVPYGDEATQATLKPWQFFLLAGMLAATASVVVLTGHPLPSVVTLSLTVVAASMAGLGLYRLLVPFASPAAIRPPEMIGGHARAALEREKTLALRALKDLEFDRGMGKISPADFDEMSTRLRARAMGLMQQLEGAGAHRAHIERELAARLAKLPQVRLKADPTIATVPGERVCVACSTSNDVDARFCKACGAKLEAAS